VLKSATAGIEDSGSLLVQGRVQDHSQLFEVDIKELFSCSMSLLID